MHRVAVVAFRDVSPFDLAIPCEVFGRVRRHDGRAAYRVEVCGPTRVVDAGAFQVRIRSDLRALARADTIVVPGTNDATRPVPRALIAALRGAAANGTRIASICSGAFVLAAAGLLDGLRATTHWLAVGELARRHPAIDVVDDVLYVDNGKILTSAGAAAGLDLCLYLVRRDLGAAAAAEAARLGVMPLERAGSHAQCIVRPPPDDGSSLQPLLRWLDEHPHEELSLALLARRAGMSARSLSRRFRDQTGTTPAQWIVGLRVRRAQELIETSALAMERIATEVGFGSTATFRDRFRRVVGTSPQAYRRAFRIGRNGTR